MTVGFIQVEFKYIVGFGMFVYALCVCVRDLELSALILVTN